MGQIPNLTKIRPVFRHKAFTLLYWCPGKSKQLVFVYTFLMSIFQSYLRWGCVHPDWKQDSVWDPCGLLVLLPSGHVPDPTAGLSSLHRLMPESAPPLRSTRSKLEPAAKPKDVFETKVQKKIVESKSGGILEKWGNMQSSSMQFGWLNEVWNGYNMYHA